MKTNLLLATFVAVLLGGGVIRGYAADGGENAPGRWQIGRPIVTYWAGPAITESSARLMQAGGWNLVWCQNSEELDIARRFGLRAILQDARLVPQSLADQAKRAQLDALIDQVRTHPALYQYYVRDEPDASAFPALGRLVAYLRARDPAHAGYINLFPVMASNSQLGTSGDTVSAYQEYVRQFVALIQPDLISYDHYPFYVGGFNSAQYFLNLAMIRQAALSANVPFLNIVQACAFDATCVLDTLNRSQAPEFVKKIVRSCASNSFMRIPTGNELRWQAYTSLAYGAQGLSYYVYYYPAHHKGMMLNPDGSPTALYAAARQINPEFVAIATELQPLKSLGVYHAGRLTPGACALPTNALFQIDPPRPAIEYHEGLLGRLLGRMGIRGTAYRTGKWATGLLLGVFGRPGEATHVLVVNLDYIHALTTTLVGPQALESFDSATGAWSPVGGSRAILQLLPGGGRLLRLKTVVGPADASTNKCLVNRAADR